ncbi:MAG TPA: class I SAM-dependent methyltransferase [Nocardioidaceae bacterium]|nr:class I SAM-dependent methyltransferase [Nocardioidaceae bacterium]
MSASDGAIPSPNIWNHPEVYELENRAADPDQRIEAAMRSVMDWSGRDVLDLGCGTGFHLPRWAYDARSVTGVEPNAALAAIARRRSSRIGNVRVLQGTAQRIPVPDASVDMVHARWAYFFGPGCEPGLAEISRVVRRGGAAFVIDNDPTRSTFGGWFRRGYPDVDPVEAERFWSLHGWTRVPLDIEWRFGRREELEAVVGIEFDPDLARQILAEHEGLVVDYAVNLWWRRF